jgi:hypothetical protein
VITLLTSLLHRSKIKLKINHLSILRWQPNLCQLERMPKPSNLLQPATEEELKLSLGRVRVPVFCRFGDLHCNAGLAIGSWKTSAHLSQWSTCSCLVQDGRFTNLNISRVNHWCRGFWHRKVRISREDSARWFSYPHLVAIQNILRRRCWLLPIGQKKQTWILITFVVRTFLVGTT